MNVVNELSTCLVLEVRVNCLRIGTRKYVYFLAIVASGILDVLFHDISASDNCPTSCQCD